MRDAAWILSAWLMADICSGVFHWWEDRYGDPEWPVLGRYVVAPNILHHTEPRAFLLGSYLERNWTTILPAAGLAAVFACLRLWWLATVCLMLSQANEIHAWSHQRCCRVIRGLQLLGFLQSPDQHSQHHKQPFSQHFCVMSDWANPVLEAIGAWRAAEWCIGKCGVFPRAEREQA